MSIRSQSSSPDVLGPAGDSQYLISSPAPDFTGRQSWVAPYAFQTPRRKERHPSRSPTKSSHTIRFDDILLPSSPPMRIANRQRSLSPTKVQSESNVSPWRIRVTVEAEHEDDETPTSSPRKRRKSTITTKRVPLKDEKSVGQVSPKKRRGRPRKSDTQEPDGTPKKGSPGRTPKPKASSAIKRPRGRPRRGSPDESITESIEMDDSGGGVQTNLANAGPVNGHLYPILPSDLSNPDPIDGDADTDVFDTIGSSSGGSSQSSIERTPERQEKSPIRRARIIEGASELTPMKTMSAVRRHRGVSPENILHAGHTPRVPRTYPTPTSSSLVDDENVENTGRRVQQNSQHDEAMAPFGDPTDEHREFDSIIESEGFSMVSLESLPSAKQQGLNSILSSAKGALKPFFERQATTPFDKKKLRISNSKSEAHHESTAASAAEENPIIETLSPPEMARSPRNSKFQQHEQNSNTLLSSTASPSQQMKRKGAFPSLVRIVRAGIALRGTLRRQQSASSEDFEGLRKRFEDLFSGFSVKTQRELRAGLRFGEQLARRQIEAERIRTPNGIRQSSERNLSSVGERMSVEQQPPPHNEDNQDRSSGRPLIDMEQLEAEWQRERELVSREIAMANSSQVIVIESDAEDPPLPDSEEQLPLADGPNSNDNDDDNEDYGDIWQEEARHHETEESDQTSDASDDASNLPSYTWNTQRGEIPSLGKSQLAKLRQEKVDLSDLLNSQNTPNTRRYYHNSSPRTVASQYPQSSQPSIYRSDNHREQSSARGVRNSSPERHRQSAEVDDEDPHPSFGESIYKAGGDDFGDQEDIVSEGLEIQADEIDTPNARREFTPDSISSQQHSMVTPDSALSNYPDRDTSKPSWFRRITNSFTPGWWVKGESEKMVEAKFHNDDLTENHVNEVSNESTPMPPSKRPRDSDSPRVSIEAEPEPKKPRQTKALATSGYFTNDHYVALKRLYTLAKRSPEHFPYYSTPLRDDMIGDWLWTSDGVHGLHVTEIQFGIVEQFVRELSEADRRNGGTGEIGWSEDDLHKRLFSIIVGEEIRRERNAQAREQRRR